VESFDRPGANVTGLYMFAAELDAKRLELLLTALPNATRVAVLNPGLAWGDFIAAHTAAGRFTAMLNIRNVGRFPRICCLNFPNFRPEPAFIGSARALGKEVLAELQSVIDSRADAAQADFEELEAAAKEQDARKAFWMYVSGPTFATSEKDFIERVLPAVRDLPLDEYGRAQWIEEFGTTFPPTADTKYGDALGVAEVSS
jgi:hypothetical protein